MTPALCMESEARPRPDEREGRSMNIIRVIFLMALELTVIYTRETDRVPMTASDLVAAGGQGAAAAVVPPPPPPPRRARRPRQKKTKTHRNKRWRSSSLLRDLPGLASPFAEIAPGREGLPDGLPGSIWNFQSCSGYTIVF